MRHAPLDRCMYCLATGTPRTEEHLVPRALGGRPTLRDAVCEPCRRLTGRLEQATLDREFAVPRTLLALKRRRARAKGPSHLPWVAIEGDTAPSASTPATFPRTFSLPAFDPPGLLAGHERTAPTRIDFVDCHLNLGTPTRQARALSPPLVDPHAYAHSIAKWAYALAVAERGLACCDTRPMRDLLLGRRDDVFAFVGTPAPRVTASREWLHDFDLHDDGAWLTVTLALFASGGMTPYQVVIGRTGCQASRAGGEAHPEAMPALAVVPRGGLEPPCP
ncbi:MAG: hypothetical protein H7276_07380 [Caulobacter sp.]|nr:hypothetical protein [Vitreoscilla sp.]